MGTHEGRRIVNGGGNEQGEYGVGEVGKRRRGGMEVDGIEARKERKVKGKS